MKILRLMLSTLGATVLALAMPTAAAATTTYHDSISGYEYRATSTKGDFAGTASGDLPGYWQATVYHEPLSPNGNVTGGSFYLATSVSGTPTAVYGHIATTGGAVIQTNAGANCTNQVYAVSLILDHVTASGTGSGTGTFSGTLTHLRRSVYGYCLTYSATITGSLDLSF
jgi:hypothetical protein